MRCLEKRMEKITYKVNCQEKTRADVYLSSVSELTRSHIKKLFDTGMVKINGEVSKAQKKVIEDDLIQVDIPESVNMDIIPEDIPIEIVYQDKDVAIINKPQGMTVHAGNGTSGSTLVNALLYHLDNLSGINGVIRPGIVHRIDKNTSGLLVVAKNDKAHTFIAEQLTDKRCKRIYLALLEGVVKTDRGTIDTFIGRNPKDRTKMAVVDFGRRAITNYKVIQRYEGYTLCEFSLLTGRTHQIRVHCKHIGHPVVGDPEYGYKTQKFKLDGQLLHAKELEFIHPTLNERVNFTAPIPDYFEKVLKKLKKI